MRFFLSICTIFLVAAAAFSQAATGFDLNNYGVSVEPDKRVMVVLATLNAAQAADASGAQQRAIDVQLSPAGVKFRERLEADLAQMPADLRGRISQFVATYKKNHPKETPQEMLTAFISMAYALTPVPELGDPIVTSDLPGALLDVLDFAPLVRDFYRRSGIAGNLDGYVKLYKAEAAKALQPSTRDLVTDTLDYLHTKPRLIVIEKIKTETTTAKGNKTGLQKISTREHERRFVVVPEMLAPQQAINFINVRDNYYVVVSPDKELTDTDANRAFLQFVFDPMLFDHSKEINDIKDGVKSLLDEQRKAAPDLSPDVFLAVSRSIVAAAEAREREFRNVNYAVNEARKNLEAAATPAEKEKITGDLEKYRGEQADETARMLSEAYERGGVLAFYFNEQLKGTEDTGFDISGSIKEMLLGFDAAKEKGRLAENAAARKRAEAVRSTRRVSVQAVAAENPMIARLLDVQKVIAAKDYPKAEADLKAMLGNEQFDARVYYNLGRVAGLEAAATDDPGQRDAKLKEAKEHYVRVLSPRKGEEDKALFSLTYVALGRIYEFFAENAAAAKLYDAAIKIGDVTGGDYKEAVAGKARVLKAGQ
ncbi:MAG: hypothetical protein UZ17_ACD001001493 [Acidobacteria bacterium OLB17]|nr:MAG: hypothetical protein UZ17_ACD001001493 [Acidobacteria bacterium OLB17]